MRFLFTLVTAVFLGNIAAAATVGDDGLHIQPWIRDTFKDLQEAFASSKSS
ncbi:MAG: thioredoxin, partial [Rhodobacteraceae bacterium]|nr:thioredoxin [Paracoccaceae bacterium]